MISLIVAVAENGVIGDRNALLWHISEDLRHFKAVTTGHPVVIHNLNCMFTRFQSLSLFHKFSTCITNNITCVTTLCTV